MIDLGSHRLRDIDRPERVYQVVVADLPRTFPPLRSLSTRRSNLPVPLTSFVGRDKELAEVATLLERHRLVTVVGTGGTGKTRLMLEAAGRILDRFPDGVWLAELAPLGDPAQIPSEVARALGAPELPGVPATATVTAFVADKELLLLLDNAEHLVDGTAAFAERLLAGAPGLRILATSREALAVSGEAVLPLQSLSCPRAEARSTAIGGAVEVEDAASTEAVQLFTQRAAAVDPAFTLGRSNVAAVGEICRRVDGIPLAIELAAARVSAMSPDEIATRLGDRFRLLTGGRRTAVPRQQTLHALIDWSWDLLTEEDRRLLRRLSVFVGGWTVPMAAQIVGDEPDRDGLARPHRRPDATGRSLARDRRPRHDAVPDARDHPPIRAREARGGRRGAQRSRTATSPFSRPWPASRRRHCAGRTWWTGSTASTPSSTTSGAPSNGGSRPTPGVPSGWRRRCFRTGRSASCRRTTTRGSRRPIEFARKSVIGRPDAEPAEKALAARLLGEAARLWGMSGRGTVAYGWAEDAIRLAEESGDTTARLAALAGLGIATVFTGRSGAGGTHFRRLFEEASDLAEELGQWWLLAISASFAGASLVSFDADGDAALLLRRGVDAARRSGSPYAIGSASMAQGRAFGREGDTDGAIAAFAIAIQRFTEIGDDRFVLACRSDLAHALRRGGRFEQALALYRETIPAWVRLGHKGAIANQLENVAYVLIARDDYEAAVRLLGAADAIREAADARMAFDEEPEHNGREGSAPRGDDGSGVRGGLGGRPGDVATGRRGAGALRVTARRRMPAVPPGRTILSARINLHLRRNVAGLCTFC